MADNKEMQIVLQATLDKKASISNIKKDIEGLRETLNNPKSSVKLSSSLDTSKVAIDAMKKDIEVISSKLKSSKIDIGYKLSANNESIKNLKTKINSLISEVKLSTKLDIEDGAISKIKSDIKSLQNSLNSSTNANLKISATLDTGKTTLSDIKASIQVLNSKIKDKIKLGYTLNVTNENTKELKDKIRTLNGKKLQPIELNARIDMSEKAISLIRKDVEALTAKLRDMPITLRARIETGLGEDATSGGNGVGGAVASTPSAGVIGTSPATDTSAISKTVKESGVFTTHTDVIRNNLLEIQKTIVKINNATGEVTGSVERTQQYEKVKKDLYKNQKDLITQIYDLERLKLKANDAQKTQIDEEIASHQELYASIQSEIDANQLQDRTLANQIDTYNRIQAIKLEIAQMKLSDKAETNTLAQQKVIYNRLAQLQKESYSIKTKMLTASKDEFEILSQKHALNALEEHSVKSLLDDGTVARNAELENKLLYERKQLKLDLEASEQRLLDKENKRLSKLGELIATQSQANVTYGDKEELDAWVKSMYGAEASVSAFRTEIQAGGNEVTKFTVTGKSANGIVTEYQMAIDKTTGSIYKMGQTTREAGRRQLDFLSDMKIAIARTIEWNVAMTMVHGTWKQFQQGLQFISDLDKDLTQVALTTEQTRQSVAGLAQEYADIGKEMAKTVTEISEVNTELVKQGLSLDESASRMQTILKLSASGNIDVTETTSIITSSVNALGEQADHTADVLLLAGQISASSVESVGTALTKVASSAKATGMELEEASSIISTLLEVTQESPETLGNSLKSIVARFNKVNEDTGEINAQLNDVQKAFDSVGVQFKDSNGQIRPVYDLLKDMSAEWENLTANQKAYVATLSAGTMQQNRFFAIMENFDRINEITDTLYGNSDGTLDNAYSVYLDSIEASANRTKVAIEELWISFIKSDSIRGFYDLMTKLVGIIKVFGIENTVSLAVVTGFMMKFKAFGGMQQLIGDQFKKGTVFLKMYTSGLTAQEIQMRKNAYATRNLNAFNRKYHLEVQRGNMTLGQYRMALIQARAGQLALKATTIALQSAMTFGLSLALSAVIELTMKALTGTRELSDEMGQLVTSVNGTIQTNQNSIQSLEKMRDSFDTLTAKMGKSRDMTKLTKEEQEEYNSIVQQMLEISPELSDGYDAQGNALLAYGTTIDEVIEKLRVLNELELGKVSDNMPDIIKEAKKNVKNLKKDIADLENDLAFEQGTYNGTGQSQEAMATANALAISKAKAIMADENSTDEEKKKATELLESVRIETERLNSAIAYKNSLIDEEIAKTRILTDLNKQKVFREKDYSAGTQAVGTELINSAFAKAFDENIDTADEKGQEAIAKFQTIVSDMQKALDDGLSDEEKINVFNRLATEIESFGFSTEDARYKVYDLMVSLEDSVGVNEEYANSVNITTDVLEEMADTISSLIGMYGKLTKGQKLSSKELLNLISTYPKIAKYISETKDLQLDNGEILKELSQEQYEMQIQNLEDQKEAEEKKIAVIKEEIEAQEKRASFLKKMWGEDSEMAKKAVADLEEKNKALELAEQNIENVTNQATAMGLALESGFNNEIQEADTDTFQSIQNKIKAYQDLIDEIDKYGKLSGQTNANILINHPELIGMLGREGEMRAYLIQAMAEQGEAQQEIYRKMLMNSEDYCSSLLLQNNNVIKRLAEAYNIDLKNFSTVQGLKAQIAGKTANTVLDTYKKMYAGQGLTELAVLKKAESALVTTLQTNPNNWEGEKTREEYQTELDNVRMQIELEEQLQNTINGIGKVDFTSSIPSSSSSSSSKATKRKIDLLEVEIDRYLKLSKAIEQVNQKQTKNQQLLEHATDKDRLQLLDNENAILTKKQQLLTKLNEEQRRERNELKSSLSKKIGMNNDTYGIDNYNAYVKKQTNAINGIIKQINASTNDKTIEKLEEQKEGLEKALDKFKEDFERYIELEFTEIPETSLEWWDIAYEKFENTLDKMETDLGKYETLINRINLKMNLLMSGKFDEKSKLTEEFSILNSMTEVYKNSIDDIEAGLNASMSMVSKYEKQLTALGGKRNDEYERISRQLVLARAEQDAYLEKYEQAIGDLASHQQSLIDKYSENLENEKEKIIKSFEDIREAVDEMYKYSVTELETSIETIVAELDKIDGIFMKGAEYNLSTSDARKDLATFKDDIKSTLEDLNEYNSNADKIMNTQAKTEEERNKKREDLIALIQSQIEYETKLKEEYEAVNNQILEMELNHKKIEDALQNEIDLKQEQLDALQEQYEKEDKIKSMLEKQLELMRAMDDTRYSYITGQGEEIFTYDQSKVMELQKQIAEQQTQDARDKELEAIQSEIDEMTENLEKTKEINSQQLAVLELQKDQLSNVISLLGDMIEDNMGEDKLEKLYSDILDAYVDSMQETLDPFKTLLENIYNVIKEGQDKNIASSVVNSTSDIKTPASTSQTKQYTIQKGDTLASIAKKHGISVQQLINMNPDKNWNKHSMLYFNQKMNVPAFDTGGYTGDWAGNEGRLAMLHKKEIVLNQDDTKNLLSSIDIARSIADSVSSLKMPTMSKEVTNTSTTEQQIIQNLNIYGVKDVNDFKNEMQKLFRRGMPTLS